MVFRAARVAVFLDGCYWHGCPEHHRLAAANQRYWAEKVRRNQERDAETNRLLVEADWLPIRIWEHQGTDEAAQEIAAAVRSRLPKRVPRD